MVPHDRRMPDTGDAASRPDRAMAKPKATAPDSWAVTGGEGRDSLLTHVSDAELLEALDEIAGGLRTLTDAVDGVRAVIAQRAKVTRSSHGGSNEHGDDSA